MLESLIVLSLAGLFTGIVFSAPAAGPITILIVSNALKGKKRYCHRVAYGAAIADLLYTFIAIYSFSHLYRFYEPYIPYIVAAASIFLIFIGIRLTRTQIDYEHMDDKSLLKDKLRNKGGFRIGMMVNLLNPALFVGWLVSSFLVITLVASMGYSTGGLSDQINKTIKNIDNESISKKIEEQRAALENLIENMNDHKMEQSSPNQEPAKNGRLFFSSLLYAVMVTIGSTAWFYGMGNFMISRRKIFKLSAMNNIVNGLGYVLIIIGVYLAYSAIRDFFF